MTPSEVKDFHEFARGLAREAGGLIQKWRADGFAVDVKDDRSVVTQADRETEQLLRERILSHFPDHSIIGEEFPSAAGKSEFTWILDPIDGTLNFCHDLPTYGCIIGLYHNNLPLVGVIDHPALGLTYSAARGLGAYCNETRLRIRDSGSRSLETELIAISNKGNFLFTDEEPLFGRLMMAIPNARMYYDCFSHTLAARGAVTTLAYNVHQWDLAATQILIEEAGGAFCLLSTKTSPKDVTYFRALFGKPTAVDLLRQEIERIMT